MNLFPRISVTKIEGEPAPATHTCSISVTRPTLRASIVATPMTPALAMQIASAIPGPSEAPTTEYVS